MPQHAKQTPLPQPQQAAAAPPQQQQQGEQSEASQSEQQKGGSGAGASGAGSPSSANQSSEGRKISCEDIQLVQNLIERCLQLYMNQQEVVNTLLNQAKIEPGFTSLVWQKLEEQNPDFFKAYYTRLKLKKHIMTFNILLEQQYHLMQKMRIIPTKPPMQGMHPMQMGQVPMGYPMPQLSMPAPVRAHMSPLPPPVPRSPRAVSGNTPVTETFRSPQGSPGPDNVDLLQCPSSGDLPSSSSAIGITFPFGSDISGIGSLSLDVPFTSNDPNQPGGLTLGAGEDDLNNSRESLGALGHLPRNFSLSDLAAELGQSDLEALGNYSSSPFMSPDAEAFFHSPDKDIIDHDKLLDDLDFGDLK